MIRWLIVLIRLVVAALKSRRNLLLENSNKTIKGWETRSFTPNSPRISGQNGIKKERARQLYHLYGVERRQAKGRKKALPSACSKKADQKRSPKQARVCN
jgi:hypothetical protein